MSTPIRFQAPSKRVFKKLKFKPAPDGWNKSVVKAKMLHDVHLPPTKSGDVVYVAITLKEKYPFIIGGENGDKTYQDETVFLKELEGIIKNDDWFFGEETVYEGKLPPFKQYIAEQYFSESTKLNYDYKVPDKSRTITKEQLEKMDGDQYIFIDWVGPSVAITNMKGNRYDVWRSVLNNGNGGWYRAGWDLKKAGNANVKLLEYNRRLDKEIDALEDKQDDILKALDALKAAKV